MSETKLIDINELKFDQHNFNQHNEQNKIDWHFKKIDEH